jgi:hypothetical protein
MKTPFSRLPLRCFLSALYVMTACHVVHGHWASPAHGGDAVPALATRPLPSLPAKVREMQEAVLAAARTGDVEAMRTPLEWNELKPEIGPRQDEDPIAHWRKLSPDGHGRDILASMVRLIEAGPAVRQRAGQADLYIWPWLAEADLAKLTAAEEALMAELLPAAELAIARTQRRWTWYRLIIGADGTWHAFKRDEP